MATKKKNPITGEQINNPLQNALDATQETVMPNRDKGATPKPGSIESSGGGSGKAMVVLPDGRTFMGLNSDDVKLLAAQQAAKVAQPGNIAPIGTAQGAVDRQQAAASAFGKPTITEEDILRAVPQETSLENIQAGGAGVGGALAGGLAGAKLGAGVGTAAMPGLGTIAGAIGGAVIGAIGGAYAKITLDKRGDVKQAMKVGRIANTNFGQTIDALNAKIIPQDEALKRWNESKVSLYAARANLKRETDKDLDRFLSGGADELAQIEDYIRDLETIYEPEFAMALTAPNPQNIKYLYQNGVTSEE